MQSKTEYKYYLANGVCLEYSLSPDTSLVNLIDKLVSSYYSASGNQIPDTCWVRPDIVSILNKEVAPKMSLLVANLPQPVGMQVLKFQSISGPITIIMRPDLEIPLFVGSEQELKDNSFNTYMEKILCS